MPDLSEGPMAGASSDPHRPSADDMSLAYAVPLRAIRQPATTVLQAEWTHGATCWRRTASNAMMNPLSLTGCGLSHSRRGTLSERAETGDIEIEGVDEADAAFDLIVRAPKKGSFR
jgi:hypothetical protein